MTEHESIETVRLYLCRPVAKDTPVLSKLWSNEQVRYFLGGTLPPAGIETKIRALLQHWQERHFGQWVVWEKATHTIVGLCGLNRSEEGVELSYMFFPTFWKRGLAREATTAVIHHGFDILAFTRIVAITQQANRHSCRLLEQVGMQHRHNLWRWDALQCFYEITRAEWLIQHREAIPIISFAR